MTRIFNSHRSLAIACAALLSGCTTLSTLLNPSAPGSTPTTAPAAATAPAATAPGDATALRNAERDLALGRRAYEDGDYRNATRLLQSALNAKLPARDRVVAHKYLAFIFCAQSQIEPCRAQFNRAFEANPQFELTPSEAGHPLWGPVYREIAADVIKRRARR